MADIKLWWELLVFKVRHWLSFNSNIKYVSVFHWYFSAFSLIFFCFLLWKLRLWTRAWLCACARVLPAELNSGRQRIFEISGSIARPRWRLPLAARCCDSLSDSGHGDLRTPVRAPAEQLTASLTHTSTKSSSEWDPNAPATRFGLSLVCFRNPSRSVVLYFYHRPG